MRYPVVEIFNSIQGEGLYTGTPANFIRLAGCNLSCRFCDTDKEAKEALTPYEILERLHAKLNIVIITGGEPLIHDLRGLLLLLRDRGYILHLETNGTLRIPKSFDYVSVSPKRGSLLWSKDWPLAHEAKWLIPEWSYEEIHWAIALRHYLQPVNNAKTLNLRNLRRCLWLLENVMSPKPLGLSVQLHKLIGVK